MNTKKVIKALERWSPHGLCAGILVDKNGVRSKTEACAVGCLALEFLHSKPGAKWLGDRDRKEFIENSIYGQSECSTELDEAIVRYYDFEPDGETIGDIMHANDSFGAERTAEENERVVNASGLPKTLARTILSLRKRFDKWIEKNPVTEDECE